MTVLGKPMNETGAERSCLFSLVTRWRCRSFCAGTHLGNCLGEAAVDFEQQVSPDQASFGPVGPVGPTPLGLGAVPIPPVTDRSRR